MSPAKRMILLIAMFFIGVFTLPVDTSAQDAKMTEEEKLKKALEQLSPEERQRLIERWEKLKKLDEETRKKAKQNFDRLKDIEENQKSEKHEESSDDIRNRIHKWNQDSQFRERYQYFGQMLRRLEREDPAFMDRIRNLSVEERTKLIKTKLTEMLVADYRTVLAKLGFDEEQCKELANTMMTQHIAREKLLASMGHAEEENWNKAHEALDGLGLDEEAQMVLHEILDRVRFMGPMDHPGGFRQHRRMGNGNPPNDPFKFFDPRFLKGLSSELDLDEKQSKRLHNVSENFVKKARKLKEEKNDPIIAMKKHNLLVAEFVLKLKNVLNEKQYGKLVRILVKSKIIDKKSPLIPNK